MYKLRFSYHYEDTVILMHIQKLSHTTAFRDLVVMCCAFTMFVRHIIEYCSPVYTHEIDQTKAVQHRFKKKLIGFPARRYASAVCAKDVSVHLSVTSRTSIETTQQFELILDTEAALSVSCIMLSANSDISKNKGIFVLGLRRRL